MSKAVWDRKRIFGNRPLRSCRVSVIEVRNMQI